MQKQKNSPPVEPTVPEQPRQEVVAKLREVIDAPVGYNGCRIRDLTIDTPASEWPTSLDRTIPEQRAAIFNAGNPADFSVPLGETVKFTAHHWLMMCDERHDEETGELRTMAILVLFDRDGKTFRTSSQYAPRRLKQALELYTPEDWIRGITFVVRDRASKQPGRHYHDIRIAVNVQ